MIDTTANLVISKSNEVFLKINTEPHIEYELRDHFKFEVPNAKFMPQYRGRNWNGEIHLYDMRSKQIYVGLLDKIVSFCKNYGYTYKFEDNKFYDKLDKIVTVEPSGKFNIDLDYFGFHQPDVFGSSYYSDKFEEHRQNGRGGDTGRR